MQDSKKDTDVYNRLLDSEGEGEGNPCVFLFFIFLFNSELAKLILRNDVLCVPEYIIPEYSIYHSW